MPRFLGIPYPIVSDAKGYFRTELDTRTIKADLLILLLTNTGSRVMLPEYGTDLRSLIFDPNDATLAERAREMILESIRTWEPRIAIAAVDVFTMPDRSSLHSNDDLSEREGILFIRIAFNDPGNIQSIQELNIQVPLRS